MINRPSYSNQYSLRKLTHLKSLIKVLLPPIFINFLNTLLKRNIVYTTGFSNWAEAEKASKNYSADNIVKKIRNSAKLVFDGNAIYERDGVIFDRIEYSWPLLSSLLLAATYNNRLRVVDFGGALGTTFFQNQKFIQELPFLCEWRIVEQQKFVEIGKAEFSNKNISFYNTIPEAQKDGVDVVLFGGSICYVENSNEFLSQAIKTGAKYIIIDRTPITKDNDIFAVQRVSSSIYNTSYPIRIFNRDNLLEPFKEEYTLIEEWICELQADQHTTAMGFLLKRRFNILS